MKEQIMYWEKIFAKHVKLMNGPHPDYIKNSYKLLGKRQIIQHKTGRRLFKWPINIYEGAQHN